VGELDDGEIRLAGEAMARRIVGPGDLTDLAVRVVDSRFRGHADMAGGGEA
jgi:hypothetical protein